MLKSETRWLLFDLAIVAALLAGTLMSVFYVWTRVEGFQVVPQ